MQWTVWGRTAVAILAGVLWALSFPKLGIAGFAWIAPALMLAAAAGSTPGAAFRLGWISGLAFHLVALYWLLLIPIQVEPESNWWSAQLYRVGPVVGWMALSAFVALYPACWVWLAWRLYPTRLSPGGSGIGRILEDFLGAGRWSRLGWAAASAGLWVSLEMIQSRFLTGFPWNLLGASQYGMVPVIQIASFAGVYGVSFLIVWFAVSLLGTVAVLVQQPIRRESWVLELILPLLCVSLSVSYGMHCLSQPKSAAGEVKLALIQPSIPQTLIWDPAAAEARFTQLLRLSEQALTNTQPDVLIWPEAAVPSFARWDTNIHHAITNLVRRHKVWLILGSDDLALADPPRHAQDYLYFNSAFLVRPDGVFAADYRKRRLVVFGEYVPLGTWLPFLKYLTPVSGSFTSGEGPVAFRLPALGLQTAVLICFEDIFAHLAREYVEEHTDFLLNLTNNGWFGESAAQWQHAAAAVLRAVENGLPLVRCANNGLTCWVDARGRMHHVYFPGTRDIYGAGYKTVVVPTLAGGARSPTLYRQYGDWFGWGCVGLSAVLLGAGWMGRRQRERTRA